MPRRTPPVTVSPDVTNMFWAFARAALWVLVGITLTLAIIPYIDRAIIVRLDEIITDLAKFISPISFLISVAFTIKANSRRSILLAADRLPDVRSMTVRRSPAVKTVRKDLRKAKVK